MKSQSMYQIKANNMYQKGKSLMKYQITYTKKENL